MLRSNHTATLLNDGTVLVAGGDLDALATAETYDPIAGTWTAVADMHMARTGPTATLLPDGRVLVVAGNCGSPASAELYDPETRAWTLTASPAGGACSDQTATLLSDGTVLLVGGSGAIPESSFASAELYDPEAETWTATGNMIENHLAARIWARYWRVMARSSRPRVRRSSPYASTTGAPVTSSDTSESVSPTRARTSS